jgi:hypothetical protein
MELDLGRWTGEGAFTQVVIDRLRLEPRIALLRAEDAPASRVEAGYNFVSNELYVRFGTERKAVRRRAFGLLPVSRVVQSPSLTMRDLEALLAADPAIGSADYADTTMLQYLRTQRIIPPYQTRGYKLVELVRIYEVGAVPVPY